MGTRMPDTASVADMGLPPAQLAKLSPAGQKLTKGDLVALWNHQTTPATQAATLGDIAVIKEGFAPAMSATTQPEAGDINCCCCPCCCATTVIQPARDVS